MIQINDLQFSYGSDFQFRLPALEVGSGETVALVGPSGCGKTTLLMLLAGVYRAHSGQLTIDGHSFSQISDRDRRSYRARHMGLVFQEFELIDYLDVRENVLLPYTLHAGGLRSGFQRPKDLDDALDELLAATGLSEKRHARPAQLSHGQRQRLAICRALITRPKLILADEPTSSLDPNSAELVLELLLNTVKSYGSSLVLVTHDYSSLPRLDRVLQLSELISVDASPVVGQRSPVS